MDEYWRIPELQALRSSTSYVRIPPNIDVPVTQRIRKLVDTAAFQRLSNIAQLGLVSTVYPGARHTRFEHSLGVFRNALLFLEKLIQTEEFRERCTSAECTAFLVASLVHDIGHYPYAHAIEDMRLPNIQKHEAVAKEFLTADPIRRVLEQEFDLAPEDILALLTRDAGVKSNPLLCSMLSGPIDVDKFDYLDRDSMHAGVPYGRTFDQSRLISQLCVDTDRNRLAISRKGTTATEMMVFARYIMFSEVYWHHAVRSATAMLQRIIYRLPDRGEFILNARSLTGAEFEHELMLRSAQCGLQELCEGLFGKERRLFKRIAQYDILDAPEIHGAVARRPFEYLVGLSEQIANTLSSQIGHEIAGDQILVDAPPAKLEVQFDVRVRISDDSYRNLEELSPVVKTLATQQFDNIVKRVRIFAPGNLSSQIAEKNLKQIVQDCLLKLE